MPRGKVRTEVEIQRMVKEIRRQHRPLMRQMEILAIREKTLDWVMGGEDAFIEPEPVTENDGALDQIEEPEGASE